MTRTISQNGINMIKSFEGLRLKAYKAIKTEKYYTIGYGHYGITNPNMTISASYAEELLKEDLKKFETHVNLIDEMGHYNFSQNEFDALVSFAYNIGSISQLTNHAQRSRDEIRKHMVEYVKSGGWVISGLKTRRKKELELFNTPDAETVTTEYTEDTTIREIVDDVIDGKFGNNDARRNNIYNVIQSFVNARLAK